MLMTRPAAASQPIDEPIDSLRWNHAAAAALIEYAETIGAEGLDPTRYDLTPVETALAAGDDSELNAAAASLFDKIAADLAHGAAPATARRRWRLADDPDDFDSLSQAALGRNDVAGTLAELSPRHPQFVALKIALAQGGLKKSQRESLLANMERWRWMPRELGANYVFVNIPELELHVVRDGREVSRHRIVAGARKTPTPQFETMATGVVFNPTWFVPRSIAENDGINALLRRNPAEAQRRGYYVEDESVRQKPGATNPLGQVKLVMPNPYSVLLHDTSTPSKFNREKRFLSHGCIRVEGALDFAAELLQPYWTRAAIDEIVATNETNEVELNEPIRIYVGYFTVVADSEGALRHYSDIYGLDGAIRQSTAESNTGKETTIAAAEPVFEGCLSAATR